ncbi:GntR family transcriptional regulator [Bacillus solimangrovi]|uniref:GntR family transcriptional regulator n=1 Tax=Bacillus solimangrovi TaxID=1305675 RepID=A0A1E5LJA8_9BACI|nr:GntR family transcriptional regulator [Bacillus solimangrovi]OEH94170.1 GntR family transcriptional regulator [Bacillus solimangrovi]
MFELDIRSRKAIYEQLVDRIKELIINQVLQPDEKLPSVRMLAKQLTINPNTIQKAYRELEQQGYLYSIQGKGSFVAPVEVMHNEMKLNEVKSQLLKLISEAVYLGLTKEDLLTLYEEAKQKMEGGDENDDRDS